MLPMGRKDGGRAKSKGTTVNIVIAGKGDQGQQQPPMPPRR
jgi:hypothetical protein